MMICRHSAEMLGFVPRLFRTEKSKTQNPEAYIPEPPRPEMRDFRASGWLQTLGFRGSLSYSAAGM